MQTRPEMFLFPFALLAFVAFTHARYWRVLLNWRTLGTLAGVGLLLVPRLLDLQLTIQANGSPGLRLPTFEQYWNALVLLRSDITPSAYRAFLVVGFLWGMIRRPGPTVWVTLVFVGFSLFSLSLFNNGPYNVRSQLFPTSFLMMIAAGAASAGMALFGHHRRGAAVIGSLGLLVLSVTTAQWYGFITGLRDQQLEWTFLERTVPRLPQSGTLLAAVEWGGRNLDAFPIFLLSGAGKKYEFVDLRLANRNQVPWPTPIDDLIYYQGMFCYFAFTGEPLPVPMTADCQAVHDRYVLEPLFVENLDTQGYSALTYAEPPFRIGFFRLKSRP